MKGDRRKERWTGSVVVEVGKPVVAGKVHSVECIERPRAGVGMLQEVDLQDVGVLLLLRCLWALCTCPNAPVVVAVVCAASCWQLATCVFEIKRLPEPALNGYISNELVWHSHAAKTVLLVTPRCRYQYHRET